MKILFLMKTLRFDGGVETSVASLVNALSDSGNTVFVAALCGKQDNKLRHRIEIKSDRFLYLGSSDVIITSFRQVLTLRKFLVTNEIDIISTHLFHAGLIGRLAAVFSKTKTIYTEHSTFFHWWTASHYLIDKYLARRTDALIAVSRSVAATLASRTATYPDKIHIIPNIIDRRRFYPPKKERKGTKSIYVIGRMEYSKNIRFALDIQRHISLKEHGVTMTIVGDGSLLAEVERFIENSGLSQSVKVIAPQKDVLQLLHDASILLVTSRWEGLPMVVLEAYAAGTPVAGVGVPGLFDLIENENTGLVLDPENAEEAATRLLDLLDDTERCNKFTNNALESTRKYEAGVVGAKFGQLCERLLEK